MRKIAFLALSLILVAATALPDCSTLTNITENIPEFFVGDHVDFQIEMSGGTAPYSFAIVDGTLPGNLHLSNSGRLHGVAHEVADNTVFVQVTDAAGCQLTIAYPVRVNP